MEDKKMEEKGSKQEQIGFHKGALTTLVKEREEMIKIVGVVEQLMQLHMKALKELGVDLEEEAKKIAKEIKPKTKPMDELLK
jgi:thiaminase